MKTKRILEVADVRQIAEACRNEAARQQIAVTVAIVDDGGHLLHLERLEARPSTVDAALRKGRTAALMRAPTSRLARRIAENPQFMALDAMPIGGGVPLIVDGDCVGAIGVSGGTAEQDEAIATAACACIGAQEVF
jgi:glc operon protein GlcG